MLVDVSIGEVIDKLTILDIKKSKIKSSEQLAAIEKEAVALSAGREFMNSQIMSFWYSLLVFVNTRIWNLTDEVKSFSWASDPERFAEVSNKIFELNQQRFRLKERFNKSCSSEIQEQKSYAKTVLWIRLDKPTAEDLALVNEYSLRYDEIFLVCDCSQKEWLPEYMMHPFMIVNDHEVPDSAIDVKSLRSEYEDNSVFTRVSHSASVLST